MIHYIVKRTTLPVILFILLSFAGVEEVLSQEVGFIGLGATANDLTEKETAALQVADAEYNVTYIQLADIETNGVSALNDFDVVWWHYTGTGEVGGPPDAATLPAEAVSEDALAAFNAYVSDGGGLFLSSLAPQLATEMGLNESYPDAVFEGGTNEDTGNWGHYQLEEDHPVFEGIPNPFFTVSEGVDLYNVNFAFWNGDTPFDGTRLATIETGADAPHTTIGEWGVNGGIVFFASGVPHQYVWEGTNQYGDDLHQFTLNVIAYLDATTTSSEVASEIPKEMKLHQNHPNPFNPTTMITFDLNKTSQVKLTVYDMLGRKIAVPVDGEMYQAGQHQVTFDASGLTSGVYLYRMEAGNIAKTRTMNFIK